jgi:hypothetical protein
VIPPTTADIHAWSKVDWNELSVDDVGLAELIARASVWVTAITFRPIDSTMPVWMEPLARQAIQMRTEQIAYQEQPDYVETAAVTPVAWGAMITSFPAGAVPLAPYSDPDNIV